MADASLDDNNQFAPLFKNSKCTLFSNKRYQNHFNKSSFVLFSFFSWKLKWETCKKKKIETFFRISEAHFKFGRMKKFFCEWQKKMLDRNNLLVFSFFFRFFSLSLTVSVMCVVFGVQQHPETKLYRKISQMNAKRMSFMLWIAIGTNARS